MLRSTIYRRAIRGSERSRGLPEVMQLVNSQIRILTLKCMLQRALCHSQSQRVKTSQLWGRFGLLFPFIKPYKSHHKEHWWKQLTTRKVTLNIHWKDWCRISNILATWCKELIHWKRSLCWERLRARGEEGNQEWDGWMTSPTQWTWVWASSGRWLRTGKPRVLQSRVTKSQTWLSDWTTRKLTESSVVNSLLRTLWGCTHRLQKKGDKNRDLLAQGPDDNAWHCRLRQLNLRTLGTWPHLSNRIWKPHSYGSPRLRQIPSAY